MFFVGLITFVCLSAGIIVLADGGWFQLYASAFVWAVFSKLLCEKIFGHPMKYLHYIDIPARPEMERKRTFIVAIYLAISIWVSYLSYY